MVTSRAKKVATAKVTEAKVNAESADVPKPSIQYRFFKVFTKFLFVAIIWSMVIVTTRLLIPMIGAFVSYGSGLPTNASLDQMLVTWLLPLVFVICLLLWFEIKFIGIVWSKIKDLDEKAQYWPLMQRYRDISN